MPSHEGLSLSKRPILFFFGFYLLYPYIAPLFCNLSFYYKQAEMPGVARGILEIILKQKTYN